MSLESRQRLLIDKKRVDEVNAFFMDPSNKLIQDLLVLVEKYGGPEEINRKARENGSIESLLSRLQTKHSPYVKDLEWLYKQREKQSFISVDEYRRRILGDRVKKITVDEDYAVTLEISACQYFPFFMVEARQALEKEQLLPGRFIRVRRMKEQEQDDDLLAINAAMQIIGASWCDTLDTRGTDGSNVHLGGPETITGYFGGVGQPNDHAIRWVNELLYYYTNYGVRQGTECQFRDDSVGISAP